MVLMQRKTTCFSRVLVKTELVVSGTHCKMFKIQAKCGKMFKIQAKCGQYID